MKCDRERLSHYLDGELSPEEVGQLRAHLETCESCASDLAAFRQVEESVRRLERHATPGELRQALVQRVERRRRVRLSLGLASAALLSTACGLLLGVAGGWRPLPTQSAP